MDYGVEGGGSRYLYGRTRGNDSDGASGWGIGDGDKGKEPRVVPAPESAASSPESLTGRVGRAGTVQ